VTGEETALITGDLTLNGVTKEIVLDAVLNATTDAYPFPPYQGRAGMGVDATVTLIRSDYNLGQFAPFVSDEVPLTISIEAVAAGKVRLFLCKWRNSALGGQDARRSLVISANVCCFCGRYPLGAVLDPCACACG